MAPSLQTVHQDYDSFFLPFVDLLTSSCNLEICNPVVAAGGIAVVLSPCPPVPNYGGNLRQFDHHSPASCTFSTSAPSPQPVWWTSECFAACVVRGGISGGLRILETAVASALHGPISIGLSGVARILSGLIGKIVLPISPG